MGLKAIPMAYESLNGIDEFGRTVEVGVAQDATADDREPQL